MIEAPKHSGALITAGLALEQNRDVFALPGSVRSETSFGTNQLIKDGAKPVTCPEDILEEYAYTYAYSGSAEKDEIASTEIEGASPSGQNLCGRRTIEPSFRRRRPLFGRRSFQPAR